MTIMITTMTIAITMTIQGGTACCWHSSLPTSRSLWLSHWWLSIRIIDHWLLMIIHLDHWSLMMIMINNDCYSFGMIYVAKLSFTIYEDLFGLFAGYYFLAETWFAVLFTVIVEIVNPEVWWWWWSMNMIHVMMMMMTMMMMMMIHDTWSMWLCN